MNITQIEEIVKKLVVDVNADSVNKDEFIYQLMAAYGHRKTTIGRIKSGERNLADVEGEVRAKRHIYFKHCQGNSVLSDIDSMKKQPSVAREKIRFVIATDFNQFVAIDTRTNDTLDIEFNDLGKHFDFFLPWAGMEKAVYQGENPADVKAAEKMAKLFDLIKADNFTDENKDDTQALHNLNVFLTRLLFCFFAEDTGIFKQNQFSGELESHTKVDGSDVAEYLNRLFEVLNTPKDKRADLPDYLASFEFVNGGLFADNIKSPRFSTKSRKMLIESGSELDWSDINPDIFGSMIQAVVHPDQRGGMGMHYTSVTNIMKVIEPLFLDGLYAELENIELNIGTKLKPSRLRKLHDRISEIKLFDPACGSGNFLIIAFKELRKLEMEIIKRLQELEENENQDDLFGEVGLESSFSRINLSQFYGIELDDFAHEVAILSLWLAQHQMNVEFKAEFGDCEPPLPLSKSGNIFQGNACLMDWSDCCPKQGEIYILGNPPYLGGKKLSDENKRDMVESGLGKALLVDYIGCWFLKASQYIKNINARFAFVSTKSICQGEQVSLLWPKIYSENVEIQFCYQPFTWSNSAKDLAGVTCIIVGVGNADSRQKEIYTDQYSYLVSSISPYLIEGSQETVSPRGKPISPIPIMCMGSNAIDGKHLVVEKNEYLEQMKMHPDSKPFYKRYIGATDFLSGKERYCLWIDDEKVNEASRFEFISKRLESCKNYRRTAGRDAKKVADTPHRFCYRTHKNTQAIIFPRTTTERRVYVPVGFIDGNASVINEAAFAIYDAAPYLVSLLSSKLHYVWFSTTSGRLRTGFRYSVKLSYNNFPVPVLTDSQIEMLNEMAIEILSVREQFPSQTLTELYDPDKMPSELLAVHKKNDALVEKIYTSENLKTDSERLSILFKLYKNMTGGQNA